MGIDDLFPSSTGNAVEKLALEHDLNILTRKRQSLYYVDLFGTRTPLALILNSQHSSAAALLNINLNSWFCYGFG
ncbi:hypothetical protein BTVI_131630 [Pitangus sulphuratus]|nr:hypothetical protein BTVI_131630 [Pitangus sulphuratus]